MPAEVVTVKMSKKEWRMKTRIIVVSKSFDLLTQVSSFPPSTPVSTGEMNHVESDLPFVGYIL